MFLFSLFLFVGVVISVRGFVAVVEITAAVVIVAVATVAAAAELTLLQ